METGDTPINLKIVEDRMMRDFEIRELIRFAVIDGFRATANHEISKMARSIEAAIKEEEEKMMQALRGEMWDALKKYLDQKNNYFKD